MSEAVRRVVCLVPSLTEAIASVDRSALVGVTDWCTHPADLDTVRVRGTKNPDTKAIIALRPDVVIANKEENRELDVRRLREAGVEVWVSVIETVPQAVDAMEELFDEVLRLGPALTGSRPLAGSGAGSPDASARGSPSHLARSVDGRGP